jgi:hypothetical protein
MNEQLIAKIAYATLLRTGAPTGTREWQKIFTELIVKECMDIVSNQTTLDTNEDFREGFSHGRKLAWTEIRKHFGVEQ